MSDLNRATPRAQRLVPKCPIPCRNAVTVMDLLVKTMKSVKSWEYVLIVL